MNPGWPHPQSAPYLAAPPHARGSGSNVHGFHTSLDTPLQAFEQTPPTHFTFPEAPSGTPDFDASLDDFGDWSWPTYDLDIESQPVMGAASSGDEYATQSITTENDKSDMSKKRREQNRRAQKAFRQRKQEEVEVLRDRLSETEERLSLLQNLHHELIDAYEDLLERYQKSQVQERKTSSTSSGSSSNILTTSSLHRQPATQQLDGPHSGKAQHPHDLNAHRIQRPFIT